MKIDPKWFSVRAAASPQEPTEILIYDQIGKGWFDEDGISAKDFAEALKEIPPKGEILISINSPGGNVWDGLAIYNQLKARRPYVTARIDGVAASIASVIAMAAERVEMPSNAMLMIHEANGMAMGDSDAFRGMADKLDKHSDLLAGIYAEKTGRSRENIRAMMRAETWMDGTQAHAMGFSDVAIDPIKIAACSFDLKAFRRVPATLLENTKPPPPSAGQLPTQMNSKSILALLSQHGKPLADDSSEAVILAALDDLVVNGKIKKEEADKLKTTEAPVLVDPAEFRALTASLKQERELRIKQEFAVLAMDRPFLTEKEWLPKLYECPDDSLMGTLRQMPTVASRHNGEEPLRLGVAHLGNTLIEDYRKLRAGWDRREFALANWNELQNAYEQEHIRAMASLPITEQLRRLHSPRAINTYDAALVTDRLADSFITTLGTKLAALRGFSREFGTDRLKPRATVQVPKATVGATTQTNPSNFELGDSTTDNIPITVNQLSQCFHVTNDQLNSGHQLMTVADKNAQAFANAISDIWTALLIVGNYGATTVIGLATAFDASDLAIIYALAKNYNSKNLILDGGHLAFLLPTDKMKFRLGEEGAYNFDLIAEQNRWTGAVANTAGFICDPQAIAVASGLPVNLPSGDFIELGTISIASLGLTVQLCHWFSRAGRVHWMSYDVMFGAAAGDITAGEVLVTA